MHSRGHFSTLPRILHTCIAGVKLLVINHTLCPKVIRKTVWRCRTCWLCTNRQYVCSLWSRNALSFSEVVCMPGLYKIQWAQFTKSYRQCIARSDFGVSNHLDHHPMKNLGGAECCVGSYVHACFDIAVHTQMKGLTSINDQTGRLPPLINIWAMLRDSLQRFLAHNITQ